MKTRPSRANRSKAPAWFLLTWILVSFSSAATRAGPAPTEPPSSSSRLATLSPVEGVTSALGLPPAATVLRLEEASLAGIRSRLEGRLLIPRQQGGALSLDLERFEVLPPGAVIRVTRDHGTEALPVDVILFRGKVTGDSSSRAVVSFSRLGLLGMVESGGARSVLAPAWAFPREPGETPLLAICPDDSAPSHFGSFLCGTDDRPPADFARGQAGDARAVVTNATPLSATVAIDCDFDFYTALGSDAVAAADYVITLMGVISTLYEEQVATSLGVFDLHVWSTPDPYASATTSYAKLALFAIRWNAERADVVRDVAVLLAGTHIGGIAAGVGSLGQRDGAYVVCGLQGSYTYPTPSPTWDVFSLSHEMGHIFGSPHTHSCWWQEHGYTPSGALLDTCYVAKCAENQESYCYSGPLGSLGTASCGHTGFVPPDKGTLMSYCHTNPGWVDNVRLEFHPACRTMIRLGAEAALGANHAAPISRALLAPPIPNPASDATTLRFWLPRAGRASLEILDISGRRLWRTEADLAAGIHDQRWDGRSSRGARVSAGLYFVRLSTPWGDRMGRLVRLR